MATESTTFTPSEFSTESLENDSSTMVPYVLPYTDAWVIASTTILSIFLVFGVTANSITIAAIRSSKRLKNRYYTFLGSLCVSDIISAFVSILFLYRRVWGFLYFAWPEIFCRLYWGLDLWTVFSTALHILSFAMLRLIGVRWPTRFHQITSTYMKLWIGLIWSLTFVFGFIPHFIFNTVREIDRDNNPEEARWASCSLSPYWISTWQVYVQIIYAFFLFVPALAIIGISITIAVLLKNREVPGDKNGPSFATVSHGVDKLSRSIDSGVCTPASSPNLSSRIGSNVGTPVPARKKQPMALSKTALERRRQKDRQAVYQLFLIVGSFLFGYIPLTAFHFYTGFTLHESSPETNALDWRFAMTQYILLRFSECLNPVFYNLASKKMRDETKDMLKKCFRISKGNTEFRRTNHRRNTGTSSDI